MMRFEELFGVNYTWWHFVILIAMLITIYFLLQLMLRIVSNLDLNTGLRNGIKKYLQIAILLFEPLTALLIVAMFVMIRPAIHGIMMAILGIAGYEHIRNYIHSRVVTMDQSLQVGKRIKIDHQEGIITELGRLGIKVRSDSGLNYIPYHRLVQSGFVLTSGEKIGGYYHLELTPISEELEGHELEYLSDLLMSSPYLDVDHRPEINNALGTDGAIEVKILVKEESHIHDLITLLEEQGYLSEIL